MKNLCLYLKIHGDDILISDFSTKIFFSIKLNVNKLNVYLKEAQGL